MRTENVDVNEKKKKIKIGKLKNEIKKNGNCIYM